MSGRFADQYGTELEISGETALPGCARVWVSERCGIHVKAADFPALLGVLYEAAGLPVPVILGAPTLPPGICHYSDGVKVFTDGNEVRLQATESHSAKEYWHTKLEPADARKLAANIAALADFAEAQPDPADIEELTGFLVGAGAGLRTTGVDDIARAALLWFQGKQQRGAP